MSTVSSISSAGLGLLLLRDTCLGNLRPMLSEDEEILGILLGKSEHGRMELSPKKLRELW